MPPAVQSSYSEEFRPGFAGQIVNSEAYNKISRSATGAIGFGLPVARVGDHQCVLGSGETLESAAPVAQAGNTGNGVFAATPAIAAGAKEGTYRLEITTAVADGGTFMVEDPDGNLVGFGAVAVAFNQGGVSFTLQDGATDFAVGDGFTFAVAPSGATDDLDLLGLSVRDITLGAEVDAFAENDNVPIMTMGVMWVTAGATVTAGMLAYWSVSTSRYTNAATDVPVVVDGRQARFDSGGANGELVRLALR